MGSSVEVGQVREFEVASTAKTMRMFADQVYQHKIPAAIREVVFNGYDAQVAAGCKDRPLLIHLPSIAEQWFSVTDNGTGMSPDFVDTTYRVYGASSKDQESAEDVVGRLGLGAKAPLAVAEKFEMISRFEGMKTHYTIFWGNNGKPQSLVQSHEPTSEPNGVEVRWAVPGNRIAEYRSEIERLCAYFRPLPEITGLITTDKFKPVEIAVARDGEGKGFRYRDMRHTQGTRAVMGMIVYPIKANAIGDLTAIQSGVLGMPLDIDFKLGALEFTPGREDLSYDDRTVRAIKARLNEIAAEMRAKVDAQYANCSTRLGAHRLYRVIAGGSHTVLSNYQRVVGARWRKEVIAGANFVVNRDAFPNLAITVTTVIRPAAEYSDSSRARRDVSELDTSPGARIGIPAADLLTIYQDDLERGTKSRYAERVKSHDHTKGAVSVLVSGPQAEFDALMSYLDGVSTYPLSRYVAPKVERPKTSVKVLTRRDHGMISKDTVFDTDLDLEEEGGFYVLTRMGNLDEIDPRAFKSLYETAVETKLFDPWKENFIIVPATLLKDVQRSGKWKPMVPELRQRAQKHLGKAANKVAFAKGQMYYGIAMRNEVDGLSGIDGSFERLAQGLPSEHGIARLAERLSEYGKVWSLYSELSSISAAYGIEVEQPDLGPSLLDEYRGLLERYSFLPILLKNEPRMNWRLDDHEAVHEAALEKHYSDLRAYVLLLDGQTAPTTPTAAPVPAGRRTARGAAKDKPWKLARRGDRARLSA